MLIIVVFPCFGDQGGDNRTIHKIYITIITYRGMTNRNRKVESTLVADLKGLASQTGKDSNRLFFSTLGDLVECRVPRTRKHGEKAPAKEGFHLPASATEDVLSRSLIPDFVTWENTELQNGSRLQQKIRTRNRRRKAKHETFKRSQNIERMN